MKLGIYTIKDMVADECGPVFEAKNDEVAGRNFRQLMAREKIRNEDEFRLYKIGSYETEEMNLFNCNNEQISFGFEEVNVKSWKQLEVDKE